MELVKKSLDEKLEQIAKDFDISRVEAIEYYNVSEAEAIAAVETFVKNQTSICEVELEEGSYAWDDVHGGALPVADVVVARKEEVGYMEKRGIWMKRPTKEC